MQMRISVTSGHTASLLLLSHSHLVYRIKYEPILFSFLLRLRLKMDAERIFCYSLNTNGFDVYWNESLSWSKFS